MLSVSVKIAYPDDALFTAISTLPCKQKGISSIHDSSGKQIPRHCRYPKAQEGLFTHPPPPETPPRPKRRTRQFLRKKKLGDDLFAQRLR
jgi:hypothetical protein